MLRSNKTDEKPGESISEGRTGAFGDLFFNDSGSAARYLVVDTGKKRPGRKVLISPFALQMATGVPSTRTDKKRARPHLYFYSCDEESD